MARRWWTARTSARQEPHLSRSPHVRHGARAQPRLHCESGRKPCPQDPANLLRDHATREEVLGTGQDCLSCPFYSLAMSDFHRETLRKPRGGSHAPIETTGHADLQAVLSALSDSNRRPPLYERASGGHGGRAGCGFRAGLISLSPPRGGQGWMGGSLRWRISLGDRHAVMGLGRLPERTEGSG